MTVSAANQIIVSQAIADLFKECVLTDAAVIKATKRKESVGTTMLALAQDAESVEMFLEECARMERKHKQSKCKDKNIPRCWTQAKSNIKAAFNLKLDVKQYGTEGALRKAVNEQRKANKATQDKANTDRLSTLLAQIEASFEGAERDQIAGALETAVTQAIVAKAKREPAKGKKVAA